MRSTPPHDALVLALASIAALGSSACRETRELINPIFSDTHADAAYMRVVYEVCVGGTGCDFSFDLWLTDIEVDRINPGRAVTELEPVFSDPSRLWWYFSGSHFVLVQVGAVLVVRLDGRRTRIEHQGGIQDKIIPSRDGKLWGSFAEGEFNVVNVFDLEGNLVSTKRFPLQVGDIFWMEDGRIGMDGADVSLMQKQFTSTIEGEPEAIGADECPNHQTSSHRFTDDGRALPIVAETFPIRIKAEPQNDLNICGGRRHDP